MELQRKHRNPVSVSMSRVGEAEVDEMWSSVGKKHEPRWLWHAIDHVSGTVLAYIFGRRQDAVFLQLKKLLAPFGITRFYTDGWGAYERIPVKVGIFRDFRGFAVIEACRGMPHSSGESQERAR